MAKWCFRLGLFSCVVFPLMVVLKRMGLLDFMQAFACIKWSVYLAFVVLIVSVINCFLSLNKGKKKPLFWGMAFSLVPIGLAGYVLTANKDIPQVHNISTDTVNPPEFVDIVSLRSSSDNPLHYDTKVLAAEQLKAYPQVKSIVTTLPKAQAFERALQIAKLLNWEVVAENIELGRIEATETTLIWGFQDDIVVRFQTDINNPAQTIIDLRSVSRVGVSDLGANAKRITAFINAFNAQ